MFTATIIGSVLTGLAFFYFYARAGLFGVWMHRRVYFLKTDKEASALLIRIIESYKAERLTVSYSLYNNHLRFARMVPSTNNEVLYTETSYIVDITNVESLGFGWIYTESNLYDDHRNKKALTVSSLKELAKLLSELRQEDHEKRQSALGKWFNRRNKEEINLS